MKTTTKAKQSEPQKKSYRNRILDSTDVKENKKVMVKDYAYIFCTQYQYEKLAVKRIWRSDSGNIAIIAEPKNVYYEHNN